MIAYSKKRKKKNENNLDQFYTKENVALMCYQILEKNIKKESYDIYLEPSAGSGSFYNLLDKNKRLGIDISPKSQEIIKMDYIDFVPVSNKKYLVVGNPPFGKISSLAIKFFNKSAEFADCIAFIVPRTFKRISVQNKLNLNFALVYNEDLPVTPSCFTPKIRAKCCFQIWKRRPNKRSVVKQDKAHEDFKFLKYGPKDKKDQPTPPTGSDFVIKAYGANCGLVKDTNLNLLRPKSWHWIKSNINVELLKKQFRNLDYSISKDTVRQDSLGQKELVYLYKKSQE